MAICVVLLFLMTVFVASFKQGNGLRVAFCHALLTAGLFVAISTEVASAANAIHLKGLLLCWIVGCMIAVVVACFTGVSWASAWQRVCDTAKQPHPLQGLDRFLSGAVIVLLLLTFGKALLGAPNNYDSMTYHMARIPYWIQQQNIEFHDTNNMRQNLFTPFAEYVILHLQVLSQSDRFANLVQWSALLLSVVLATLIASRFNRSAYVQWLVALVTITIPMAIAQSTSTQNDLVAGSLVLAFAFFLMRAVEQKRAADFAFCAAALGLAMLTKATGYFFCCGIGVCATLVYLTSRDLVATKLRVTAALGCVVVFAILLNVTHANRNYHAYGHPLSPAGMRKYMMNERMDATTLYSNAVRNASLHLGASSESWNQSVQDCVERMLGEEANCPATTFPGNEFKVQYIRGEDYAGNFWHLLLLPVPFLLCLWSWPQYSRQRLGYLAGLAMGGVLFCLLLKWQVWGSRLQLPMFLLAAPFIGITVFELFHRQKIALSVIVLLLTFSPTEHAFKRLFTKGGNSILVQSRQQHYFQMMPEGLEEYKTAVDVAKRESDDEVGVLFGSNDCEYQLWVLAGKAAKKTSPEFVSLTHRCDAVTEGEIPEVVIVSKTAEANLLRGKKTKTLYDSDRLAVVRVFRR